MKDNVDQTLFIVGAGASCEAGLPSGNALKKTIASLLDIRFPDGHTQVGGDFQITEALKEAAREIDCDRIDINPFLQKAWRIRDIVPTASISIDNYLDAHRGDSHLELCGKLGIVKGILDAEHRSKLAPQKDDPDGRFKLDNLSGTWYVSLLQWLTRGIRRENAALSCANVAFITFNYDRCIEHFLAQGLADYYDLPPSGAQAIVSSIPIYHPYGSVGPLPWQAPGGATPFGSQRGNLLAIARRIKTFTEGLDEEKMRDKIRGLVAGAEHIVFLGFAFHSLNMDVLTPETDCLVERVFATTLGMSKSAVASAGIEIQAMLGEVHDIPEFELALEPMSCAEFFADYFTTL